MSEAPESRSAGSAEERMPDARAADHASIDRLAAELLPALVAKLGATGLGEIEVREGSWKVRLSRPAGPTGATAGARRASDRPSRAQPGHEGHGHAPGALEGHRSARSGAGHSTNGSGPGAPRAVGPGHGGAQGRGEDRPGADPHRAVATSPAVGIFGPQADMSPGARVRAGDRVGIVDMLGVAQDVVAPADGIVSGILVDAGDAVEYGQELVTFELTTQAAGGRPGIEGA